jgi:hypothetical protein
MGFWERWAPVALLTGAVFWLAKMSVIVATDGRVDSTGAAAVFYIGGVLLMAIGATAVGLRLTPGRPTWLRVVAMVISFVGFFVSFLVLEGIAKSAFGDAGPTYLSDEIGILVTAIFWLVAGALLVRARPAPGPAVA